MLSRITLLLAMTLIRPVLPSSLPLSTLDCQTAHSDDYYGLGVRLGIYFSWLTAYVANIALPSEIAGALDQNAIFLFVLLISMIRCSITGMLQQLDALLLMHLSGGTIFGVLSLWGYRTCQYHVEGPRGIRNFGGFGTHGRLLLSLAVSIFGLWFWTVGVKTGLTHVTENPAVESECEVLYTFMFAKVRAAGRIRGFYIFVCVACIVYFSIMLLTSSLAAWARARKIMTLVKTKQWASDSRLKFATGLNVKELHFCFQVLRVLNLAWLVFSALLVEFTLNFNHVKGVLAQGGEISLPSELIPMLVGAFSFARILWILFEEWRKPGDTSPSVADSPPAPARSLTLRVGLSLLKIFSPAMSVSRQNNEINHEDEEIDPSMADKPIWQRYVVAWLPWLSLLNRDKQYTDLPATEDRNHAEIQTPSKEYRREQSWGSDTTAEHGRAKA